MRIALIVLASAAVTTALPGCGWFSTSSTDTVAGGVGAPCSAPQDCRTGLACTSGSCQPTHSQVQGAACQLTADCVDGLYCNSMQQCEPAGTGGAGALCNSSADCQQGLVCSLQGFFLECAQPGNGDLGQACGTDLDCMAGLSCTADSTGSVVCQSIDQGTATAPPVPPQWDGASCPADNGTAQALFEIPRAGTATGDFFALPFPNDVRRTATGLDLSGFPTPATLVSVDIMGNYVNALEQGVDGFATNPVIFFRFSESYDFGTVGGGDLQLVNVDPSSSNYGRKHGIVWLSTSGRFSKYACANLLTIGTALGSPLLPGTTYAALVFNQVKRPDGTSFQRSSDLDALLGSTQPTDPVLAAQWPKYADLRDYLTSQNIDPATILNATVFTTQTPETLVPKLRQVIRSNPPPTTSSLTLCDTGVTSPCDDGTTLRDCQAASPDFDEIHGQIALPIFQQGTEPYETVADGGGIQTDASGAPTVVRTENVCFALTVPKGVTMPAAGWPLVVYAHGTGGSFRGAVLDGLADDLSTGTPAVATLAIDLPEHGLRRGGSNLSPEQLFYNFANPAAARGNVMQGAADLMSVAYAAQNFDLAAGSSPTGQTIAIDPSEVLLFAHSQGATHASIMLPYEPTYLAAVLSGNGGDLTQSLITKTNPVDIKSILPIALLDANSSGDLPLGAMHPALALWQTYFESVDPVNYAWRLWFNPVSGDPGRHVFMTYGLGDTYSTEPTMTAYALAAHMTVVTPTVPGAVLTDSHNPPTAAPPLSGNRTVNGSSWTIGLREYSPPAGVDGHFVATQSTQGLADVLRFLRQAASGTTPQIGM